MVFQPLSARRLSTLITIIMIGSIGLLSNVSPVHSDVASNMVRIQDPSSTAGDSFGWSIAAMGDNILVGAPGVNNGAGAAYLFDGTTGTLIGTYQKPTNLQKANDQFGWSVAVVGNNVLVGVPLDDLGAGDAGAVYMFDATTGDLLKTFQDPAIGCCNEFGFSLASDGNDFIVGAPFTGGFHSHGAAYVFDASGDGTPLTTVKGLTAGDFLGSSVALVNNNLLVGAPGVGPNINVAYGAAYLYDATGNELRGFSDTTPAQGEAFGSSVGSLGKSLLVGEPQDDAGGLENVGAVYLYDATTGDQIFRLQDPQANVGDEFGTSLRSAINNIIVGARGVNSGAGAAYLFDGTTGSLVRTLQKPASVAGDAFGWSVASTGSVMAVGAPGDDAGAGAVYLVPLFDYHLTLNPSGGTLVLGSSVSTTVMATLDSGENLPSVEFGVDPSSLPSGVTASFSATACIPTCSSTLTLTAIPTARTGSFTIAIVATPHGASPDDERATFSLQILAKEETSTKVDCQPKVVAARQTSVCWAYVTSNTLPTGDVYFYTYPGSGYIYRICTLSPGRCSIPFSPLLPGTYTVNGVYQGDAFHNPSHGGDSVTATPRTTSVGISCTPNPIEISSSTDCTATVNDSNGEGSWTPTGTVNFAVNGVTGTLEPDSCTLQNGSCLFRFSAATPGTASITGDYGGDRIHDTSSGTTSVPVNKKPVSISVSCASAVVVNQPSTCTVVVTSPKGGSPSGTVSWTNTGAAGLFSSNSCPLELSETYGSTKCEVTFTPIVSGTANVTGGYRGDSIYAENSTVSLITINLRTTSTSVSCAPTAVTVGESVTCSATVTDTSPGTASPPNGTVSFTPSASCTLSGDAQTYSATCSVSIILGTSGTVGIRANYLSSTESTHASSTSEAYNVSVSDNNNPNSNDNSLQLGLTIGLVSIVGSVAYLAQRYIRRPKGTPQ